MPRKPSKTPDAHMIYSDGSWRIYWRWKGTRYAVAAGYTSPKDKPQVELLRRDIASALGKEPPEFPKAVADSSAVVRYLEARYPTTNVAADSATLSPDEVLADYLAQLKEEVSKDWAVRSEKFLNDLAKRIGPLIEITTRDANKYLTDITSKYKLSTATRNRALATYKRFYGWAVDNSHATENPFASAKMLTEESPEYIAYCTKEERARVLAAAKALNRADWIAVAIAFYAGCRLEEIYRLRWEDVFFDSNRLIVRKAKTVRQRVVRQRDTPLAKPLREILEPLKQPYGLVVPVVQVEKAKAQKTWKNRAERLVELLRETLCRPENPNEHGKASESIGKRHFLATDADLRGKLAALTDAAKKTRDAKEKKRLTLLIANYKKCPTKAYDGKPWMPAERVGWTPFRHTFASLLVQNGVTLDKISSWMGNTPDVCRRHYAQFVPMGQKDEDIDKLV